MLIATMSMQARATEVTAVITVTDNSIGYTNYGAAPPVPINPMIVSFKITYDPALSYAPTTQGITLISANVPHSLPLEFFHYTDVLFPKLYVGTFSPGSELDTGFDLALGNFNQNYTLEYARYVTSGGTYADLFGNGTVSASSLSAVPLPSGMPMFGTAIAALVSLSMWRSRRTTV
jgi:hypothetical protein